MTGWMEMIGCHSDEAGCKPPKSKDALLVAEIDAEIWDVRAPIRVNEIRNSVHDISVGSCSSITFNTRLSAADNDAGDASHPIFKFSVLHFGSHS